MDFARKQLEKYGWTDGKGLGKHENGISEALKPKIKRSVAGVGHDPAAEFNEHWWTALYDKAAGNVEVEDKNGKTKKIKTKDNNGVVITTSTWRLNRKQKDGNTEQYSENFVRTAVLTSGGSKVENVKSSDSESDSDNRDVFKMTDEELFAACEGRTAHKGARHGLKATGKLARIAQQEALLLKQARFSGYSHAKKLQNRDEEDNNVGEEIDTSTTNKKKKKRKRNNSNDNLENVDEIKDLSKSKTPPSPPLCEQVTVDDSVASDKVKSKKSKKRDVVEIDEDESSLKQKKKKHKVKGVNEMETICYDEEMVSESKTKKKKKKISDS